VAFAGAIRAGKAFVELFADDSKLVRGLKAAEKKVKAFGNHVRNIGLSMSALGAAVMMPLLGMAKGFADTGSKIYDMSKRTGVSAEALSVLGYAAEQTGTDVDALEKGLRKMRKTVGDAIGGSKSAQKALGNLGLTVQDLQGLSPDQQFRLIADRIDKISDPALKAAAAASIFGTRIGPMLMPMLEGGAAALDDYAAQAEKLGLIMSSEDAAAADAFGDGLKDLTLALKKTAITIGAALAPFLKDLAAQVTSAVVTVATWIRQNQGLVVSILKISAIVVAAGIALSILGTIIGVIGTVIGVVVGIITVFGAILSGVITVISAIGAVIGFLLTPLGAVIALVVALGAYLVISSGAGGQALGWLGEQFSALFGWVKEVVAGIFNAIKAGDLGLAAIIAWAGLKVVWIASTNWLLGKWHDFWDWIIKLGNDMWTVLLVCFSEGWYGIKIGWEEVIGFIRKLWTDMKRIAVIVWNSVTGAIVNAVATAWNALADLINGASAALDKIGAGFGQVGKMDLVNIGAKNDQANQEADAEKAAIDKEKQDTETKARQEADQRMGGIAEGYQKFNDDMAAKKAKRDQEAADELAAAQKELNDALGKAAQEAGDAEKKQAAGPEAPKAPELGSVDVGGALADQAAKIGVRGTFNASNAAIAGLMGGDAADRTAKATEDTAKYTKKTYEALDDMGESTFA